MDVSSDVMAQREHDIRPKERKKKKKDGATPLVSNDTPPISKDTPQEHKDEENSQTPPTAPPPPDPPVRHGPKTRNEVLEERRVKEAVPGTEGVAYPGGLHPDPAPSSYPVHQHVAVRVRQGSKVGVV